MELTYNQYKTILEEGLNKSQLTILLDIYGSSNFSITAKDLAKLKNPSAKGHFSTSGQVGMIGKAMSSRINKVPSEYWDGRRWTPAYFSLVGEYDSMRGWLMHGNLKEALSEIIKKSVVAMYSKKK